MTPENMFHQMLGLGTEWEVRSSQFDAQSGLVTLHVAETPEFWKSYRCPHDKGEAFCYDHTEELVWRHLNVFEHKCEIPLSFTSSALSDLPEDSSRSASLGRPIDSFHQGL
jgi:hypothetical protein